MKKHRFEIHDNKAEYYDGHDMLEDALIDAKELENRFHTELYIVDTHLGKRINLSEGRKYLNDVLYKNTIFSGKL